MAVISVNELNKYYGEKHILKGVTFQVFEGERIGLLGKNGSGKTTLFKILSGQEAYEQGIVNVSSALKFGVLEQIPEYPCDYTVRDVLNTAFEELFKMKSELESLGKIMESGNSGNDELLLKRYGAIQSQFEASGGYVIDATMAKVCNGLDIDEEMQQRPFRLLSGGEKTRVNLGRIILENPDVLLLDEPTNHLDIASVEWLEEYLIEFKGTVIVISHDRYFLDKVVNRIVEIENGKAELYEGNYSYYVKEKEARYRQRLARYEQEQKKIKQLEETAARLHEWARNSDNPALHRRAFAIEKRIERMEITEKPLKEQKLKAAFKENKFSGSEVIVLKNVFKHYGNNRVIDGISLEVRKGEHVALIGPNGCGKTTLLKLITGEEKQDSGLIKKGESIKYGILHQNVTFENPDFNVLDTVRHALVISEEMARNRLAAFNFKGEDVFKKVASLSGGEKSRLRLCILMQQDINLLILDEPTNHLDIASKEWIEDAISEFNGTILFVSHDRYFINRFATRIWEMYNGKITDFKGTYEEYKKWKSKNEIASKNSELAAKSKYEAGKGRRTEADSKHTNVTAGGSINLESINLKIADMQKIQRRSPEKLKEKLKKKRLETENKIKALDGRINEINNEMEMYASDFERLEKLLDEKSSLEEQIDLLYEEWMELDELIKTAEQQ